MLVYGIALTSAIGLFYSLDHRNPLMPRPPTASDSQVSWQSAFWSLPPIALNVMLQPAGKVCGLPPRLRTYLRSSPILCAADTISAFGRFIVYITYGMSLGLAAKTTIVARSPANIDGVEGPPQGLQSLEQSTFLRLLGFVFGTLPQAVKLMALGGLLWTKIWGGMYLVNFALNELLWLLAKLPETKRDKHFLRSGRWIRLTIVPISVFERRLQIFELCCAIGAGGSQVVLLIWSFHDLVKPFSAIDPSKESVYSLLVVLFMEALVLNVFPFNILMALAQVLARFDSWRKNVLCLRPRQAPWSFGGDGEYEAALGLTLLLFIVVLSYSWYAWRYDPTATYQPDWTKLLG